MSIVIDRMDLADLGNPVRIAAAIMKQIGNPPPVPVPIERIAEAVGIKEILDVDSEAFEGALITDSDKMSGSILCRQGAGARRRRFTVGHELGHYLNPWHVPSGRGFECTKKDFQAENGSGLTGRPKWEAEANSFATEMLMPSAAFGARLRSIRTLEIEAIVRLSDDFEVSKLACARRVLALEQEVAAVVVSRHGKLQQLYRSREFPFISLRKGMDLNRGSSTRQYAGAVGTCSSLDYTEPTFWTDRPLHSCEMFEQVLVERDGWRLTLLVHQETEEEEVPDSWRAPGFDRRR